MLDIFLYRNFHSSFKHVLILIMKIFFFRMLKLTFYSCGWDSRTSVWISVFQLGSQVVILILDHSNCFVVSDLSVFLPKTK